MLGFGPISTAAISSIEPVMKSIDVITIASTITDAAALVRNRGVLPALINLIETETFSSIRTRAALLPIAETESITPLIKRVLVVGFPIAEALSYNFIVDKLRMISMAVAELEVHSIITPQRVRDVLASIGEVAAYVASLQRARAIASSIAEQEVLTAVLVRLRTVQESIQEIITSSESLDRARLVQTTITEICTITVEIVRLQTIDIAIVETQLENSWIIKRLRDTTLSIDELESIQSSINLARSFITAIDETQAFTVEFNRLRNRAVTIAESQGTEAALDRARNVIQAIANVTNYTFAMDVYAVNLGYLKITVTWNEWITDGIYQRFIARTETISLQSTQKSSQVVAVTESATVTVPANPSYTVNIAPELKSSATLTIPSGVL